LIDERGNVCDGSLDKGLEQDGWQQDVNETDNADAQEAVKGEPSADAPKPQEAPRLVDVDAEKEQKGTLGTETAHDQEPAQPLERGRHGGVGLTLKPCAVHEGRELHGQMLQHEQEQELAFHHTFNLLLLLRRQKLDGCLDEASGNDERLLVFVAPRNL
jgi:hypothetical protein